MTKHYPLKIGTPVCYFTRGGAKVCGRVDGTDRLPNGLWISVNIAPRGANRLLKRVRPSQLMREF